MTISLLLYLFSFSSAGIAYYTIYRLTSSTREATRDVSIDLTEIYSTLKELQFDVSDLRYRVLRIEKHLFNKQEQSFISQGSQPPIETL